MKEDVVESFTSGVKHQIPHRFLINQNISVSWCCHCGTILTPLSKRQSLKCSECSVTCHRDCSVHLPPFCGLSLDLLNQVRCALEESERTRRTKNDKSVNRSSHMSDQLAKCQNVETGRRLSETLIAPRVQRIDSYSHQQKAPKGIGLDDFTFLAVLGKGNFGKVVSAQALPLPTLMLPHLGYARRRESHPAAFSN